MRTLKYLGLFVLWNLAISVAAFLLDPMQAIPIIVGVYLLLVAWLMTGTGRSTARRRALLRLRPLRGDALRWTVAAIPALLFLAWSLESVYVQLVSVPAETLDPLGPLMETSGGVLLVALLAVGMAPVAEEIFFRGFIQRTLELRHGPVRGIAVASVLFAAIHLLPWVLPLHFFLGAAFGFAVYATRSLWAGIVLHAANNTVALIGLSVTDVREPLAPTVWDGGPSSDLWASLAALAVSGAVAGWVARRLWWAGRRTRTFTVRGGPSGTVRPPASNLDPLQGG